MQRPPSIGRNIRKIRKEQKLTLDGLAERSGVSKAMLSQVESEKVNPTVATVWKIAHGLGVDLNALLKGESEPVRIFEVHRRANITALDTEEEGTHIHVLSPIRMAEDLELYVLTFEPHGAVRSAPHFPGAEEFCTVLQGKIRVSAGSRTVELDEGDFAMYHCDVAHSIENLSDEPAKIYLVVRFAQNQGV
ncbi:MAG: helix-turn-helix transcriptional regulator [Kiritimatiellae bacterium]|nr:helix-turn-helix transcriptional regulator [Kiritimatiellia bacterium]